MAVKIVFFSEVTPYSLVNRYQCFIEMTRNMISPYDGVHMGIYGYISTQLNVIVSKAMTVYLQVIIWHLIIEWCVCVYVCMCVCVCVYIYIYIYIYIYTHTHTSQ